jgi:hypothetical protein
MRRVAALLCIAGSVLLLASAFAEEGRRPLPKAKRLAKELPRGLDGVTIDSSAVRLQPGYKFVKQAGGAMSVARVSGGTGGGAGATGTFNCLCANGAPGPCMAVNTGTSLICMTMNPAQCSMCILQVTIFGAQTRLMSFESAAVKPDGAAPAVKPAAMPTPRSKPMREERP